MIFLVVLGIAALVGFFWQQIIDLFRTIVIPWTRTHFPKFADRMVDVMNWLDGHIVLARDAVVRFRKQYQSMVLQHFTYYHEQEGRIVQKDEIHVRTSQDEVEVQVREVELAPEDVPYEIYKELKMNGKATVDARQAVADRVEQKAQELKMEI